MNVVTKYDIMRIMIIYELKKLKDEGLLEDFIEYYKIKRMAYKSKKTA